MSHSFTTEWNTVIDKLKTVKDEFNICLTGGEPIYHPDVNRIIDGILDCNVHEIFFFTNLSHSIERYKSINNKHITFKISYHAEYDSKFKKNKLLDMKELGIRFEVLVMIHDRGYIKETKELIDFLILHDIDYDLSLLRPTDGYYPIYTPAVKSEYEEYFLNNVNVNELLNICYDDGSTDTMQYNLNYNEIAFEGFKCEAKMFQILKSGKILNACTDIETMVPGAICPKKTCSGLRLCYTKDRV